MYALLLPLKLTPANQVSRLPRAVNTPRASLQTSPQLTVHTGEEEDGLEEIDLNNIVEGGRRTRGQVIDFAKAAEQHPADDDDEDDDDDFQPPDEDTKMSG